MSSVVHLSILVPCPLSLSHSMSMSSPSPSPSPTLCESFLSIGMQSFPSPFPFSFPIQWNFTFPFPFLFLVPYALTNVHSPSPSFSFSVLVSFHSFFLFVISLFSTTLLINHILLWKYSQYLHVRDSLSDTQQSSPNHNSRWISLLVSIVSYFSKGISFVDNVFIYGKRREKEGRRRNTKTDRSRNISVSVHRKDTKNTKIQTNHKKNHKKDKDNDNTQKNQNSDGVDFIEEEFHFHLSPSPSHRQIFPRVFPFSLPILSSKTSFFLYYSFGLSLSILLFCFQKYCPSPSSPSSTSSISPSSPHIILRYFCCHFFRRLVEVTKIQKFTTKQNIFTTMAAIIFYGILIGHTTQTQTHGEYEEDSIPFLFPFGFLLFFFFSALQSFYHYHLSQNDRRSPMPKWKFFPFPFVPPHYVSEMGIYLSFILISPSMETIFALWWVTTNLMVTTIHNYKHKESEP